MPDKPWWNDSDKVGGLAATIVILALVILICLGIVKLATLMF